ncbi:hypothetical protein FOPE_02161 [Fonsecaea pedrosoi]|nr:hypothetical protein FOPE_02161 [Fonsecaea pedrosoi]
MSLQAFYEAGAGNAQQLRVPSILGLPGYPPVMSGWGSMGQSLISSSPCAFDLLAVFLARMTWSPAGLKCGYRCATQGQKITSSGASRQYRTPATSNGIPTSIYEYESA